MYLFFSKRWRNANSTIQTKVNVSIFILLSYLVSNFLYVSKNVTFQFSLVDNL